MAGSYEAWSFFVEFMWVIPLCALAGALMGFFIARAGLKKAVDRYKIPCKFVSFWDGGVEVVSDATLDLSTGIISDIEVANLPEHILESLEVLERQAVRIYDYDYPVYEDEQNGCYKLDLRRIP